MITERRILKGVTSNCAFLRNACELRISCSGASTVVVKPAAAN
jgi:hypothetical protein